MIKLLYYACLFLFLVLPAKAEAFPEKPLILLVGFNPGGSMDQQAQILAGLLEEQLGQAVEIIYFPGSGGGAAAAMLAASHEQGNILQFSPSLSFTFPPLVSSASYDLHSFRYLAAISRDQLALVTGKQAAYQDWQGLLNAGREGGELVYASQTQLDRFLVTHLAELEGLRLRSVPTTGGSSTLPLVLSGETDFAFSGGSYIAPALEGRVRVLLALGSEPLMNFPEVPTLKDAGYEVDLEVLRVLAVSANTPDSQVQVLVAALKAIVEDQSFVRLTEEQIGIPVIFKQDQALETFMHEQARTLQFLVDQSAP
ncbi:Tripartite-type tricarboxylate transporter, receptor component TctC [Marinospirillum celere]|uniref:Tripartite-type tricarboxylate transporter, receptor component TctC n=1 Tax=Marinospirillum celere TaxID=1122252 RepID=A0A1I1H3E8_9GAMM|nr:tripartite tricarboxylate transporter substrate-binding protein [Marinospirillum celere]SFC16628.1 Tripartite-type tricarboxylate transporter, receptor component TctC [Marinospirillum celere]